MRHDTIRIKIEVRMVKNLMDVGHVPNLILKNPYLSQCNRESWLQNSYGKHILKVICGLLVVMKRTHHKNIYPLMGKIVTEYFSVEISEIDQTQRTRI